MTELAPPATMKSPVRAALRRLRPRVRRPVWHPKNPFPEEWFLIKDVNEP